MIRDEKTLKNQDAGLQANEASIFFASYGKWVWAVLLLVGVWYNFLPLIATSLFLLLLSLMITLWGKWSLLRVEASLELSKYRMFPGEEFQLEASIYNKKWLPLVWLEWNFDEKDGIVLGDGMGDNSLLRFLWILWYKEVNWTIKGRASNRGVYNIGEITLCSGDGFRFSESREKYDLDRTIYIYPKLIPVNPPRLFPSLQWGASGQRGGFLEDPLLVDGIREYEDGDELRRMNWKATARTGKLQSNTYQPVILQQLVVYGDIQGFILEEIPHTNPDELREYQVKMEEDFEHFLSVIASLLVKYMENGINTALAMNALNHLGRPMTSSMPAINPNLILDKLASCSQQSSIGDMTPLEELLNKLGDSSPIFVFTYKIRRGHYLWYQKNRHRFTTIHIYYMYKSKYVSKLQTVAKSIEDLILS